ncbi:unnamed protein product [Chilo suppressalis]|uniref:Translation initiation factor eIF2B subunit delta n=1 Tax=Chilo suppressalis TaxID=168631 RepID=A0ABN8L6Y5_CHISP|nr:unnamed protein product [Chilo suppressalis]
MSSHDEKKSRDEVLAAREAKKLAKLKGKNKAGAPIEVKKDLHTESIVEAEKKNCKSDLEPKVSKEPSKSKDEVDRALAKPIEIESVGDKTKEEIKADRAAKKAAKQAKKKKDEDNVVGSAVINKPFSDVNKVSDKNKASDINKAPDMTVKDVVDTLKDIAAVAREVQDVTAKTPTEESKSKAELRAERRAKQEAQRAAKQASVQQVPKIEKSESSEPPKEVKLLKAKSVEIAKPKSPSVNRVNWFEHLHVEHDKDYLTNIPINSNLHPAIVKLGVQLATRVVSGSNARCIALLDALKKMIRDYSLPARTEFSRGLEAALTASLQHLWRLRQPCAAQENAVKFLRRHISQLPNNVDEFDAKKTLQEEIDRYIREQIEMAGEAISLAVRNKISNGDNILTYGSSSLVERILREAWEAGVRFRAVIVGTRTRHAPRHMMRRLAACGVPCAYADLTALTYVMHTVRIVLYCTVIPGSRTDTRRDT